MPEIEIRSAKSEDFANLSALEHGYYSEYVWQMSLEHDSQEAQADFRRVRLPRRVFVPYPKQRDTIFVDPNQTAAFLVAEIGEQPVGYIKVLGEDGTRVARVSDLVISSSMRRKGIASGLLLAIMDFVTHRQFHTLILEMQSKNDPAINMAIKLGFDFCGFRDHYFSNQDLALFFSRFTQ